MKTDIRHADFWPLIITVVQLKSLEINRLWEVWDGYFDKRPTPRPKRAWLEHRLAHALNARRERGKNNTSWATLIRWVGQALF